MHANDLGVRCIVTVLILILLYWFISVAFLGRHVALDLHANLLKTEKNSPLCSLFRMDNEQWISQWSTQGRYCFREQSLIQHFKGMHRLVSTGFFRRGLEAGSIGESSA
jgi:hypothetical protein